MKYQLIKQKALLQILLVISLSFYTSFSFAALNQTSTPSSNSNGENKLNYFDIIKQDLLPSVNADSKVCCEKTSTSSIYKGTSCVYTEESNCDSNLPDSKKLPVACEQTDYCVPSCCINDKGQCESNVEKSVCEVNKGIAKAGECNIVNDCRTGCCSLPSGASLTTLSQCKTAIKDFRDLNIENIFDENIKDEATCVQKSRGTEEGCCVLSDKCEFGTRKECNDFGGDPESFKLNTLCSYPVLGCRVTEKHHTSCYQGKVYWLDSSNNRENVFGTTYEPDGLIVKPKDSCTITYDQNTGAIINDLQCGNCDYSSGSICDDTTSEFKSRLKEAGYNQNDLNKITNQCISLNCPVTQQSKKNSQGSAINPWMSQPRRNGESWCEYEGATGEGKDLVGSRQYKHICRNGKDVIEECQTQRKQFCVQDEIPTSVTGFDKSFSQANCVANNWPVCSEANKEESCNLDLTYNEILNQCGGECDVLRGIEEKESDFSSCCTKQLCRKQKCESFDTDCYWSDAVKLCAPAVPPGTLEIPKKDELQTTTLAPSGSEIFSYQCKEIWAIEGPESLYNWNCAGNCENENRGKCSLQPTVDSWNNYCRSLGDYGAHYNVVERFSRQGFIVSQPTGYEATDAYDWDGSFIPEQSPPNPSQPNKNEFNVAKKPLNGTIYTVLSAIDLIGSRVSTGELDLDEGLPNLNNWILGVGLGGTTLGLVLTAALSSQYILIGGTLAIEGVGITGLFASLITEFGSWGSLSTIFSLSTTPLLGILTTISVIISAIIVLYLLVDWILGLWSDQKEVTYAYSCQPWVPPTKGNDCNKCNDFEICDEYKCASLGQGCELINLGFPGNETCVWKSKGEITSPVIKPLPIAPLTLNNFNLIPSSTGIMGGYEFQQKIPSFKKVQIGIETNEYAQCKISRFAEKSYDEMTNFFGGNSPYLLKHIMDILPAREGISPSEDRIEVESGKINNFYVKCQDINENKNEKSYFIKFNVDDAPDLQPAIIESFSPKNNAFIKYNLNQTSLAIYLNEPVSSINGCKYSTLDQSYNLMPKGMSCLLGLVNRNQYSCNTKLDIKPNQDNIFYFRCNDTSGNINVQSQPIDGYKLIATKPLKIAQSGPNGNILVTDVNLTITTSEGAENGKSKCYYSLTNSFSPDSIKFTTTDVSNHETQLSLQNEKDYKFYLWCRDVAGNEDNTTIQFHTTTPDFNITNAEPDNKIIYNEKVGLKVTTKGGIKQNGESDCRYDGAGSTTGINDYKITQGQETTHYKNITLQTGNYKLTITCTDQYKSDKQVINFEVDTTGTPKLIRIFKQANLLNIITDRQSECHYSPTESKFIYEEANLKMVTTNNLQHQLDMANSKVFYIKCQDLNTKQISPTYTIYV